MVLPYPGWFTPRLLAPRRAQKLEADRLCQKLLEDAENMTSLDAQSKAAVGEFVKNSVRDWATLKARNDLVARLFLLLMAIPGGIDAWWYAAWALSLTGLITAQPKELQAIPTEVLSSFAVITIIFFAWDSFRQRKMFREHLEIHTGWILIESLRTLEQNPEKWPRVAFRRPIAERVQFLGHVLRVGLRSELPHTQALRIARGFELLAMRIQCAQFDDLVAAKGALVSVITAVCMGNLNKLEQADPNWLERLPWLRRIAGALIGGAVGAVIQKMIGFPEPYAALFLAGVGVLWPHLVTDVVRMFRENKPQ